MTENPKEKLFCRNTGKGDPDIAGRGKGLENNRDSCVQEMEEKRKKRDEIMENFTR